tara:strand:- start:2686 stop:3369 length:684 start_codon:yes stop_codon:yes gene_type:complete
MRFTNLIFFGVKLATLLYLVKKYQSYQIPEIFMKKIIKFTKLAILALLIFSIPYIEKAMAQFNPSNLSRIRLSVSNGGEYMPGLDATSSGSSISYTLDTFGIGYTTSSLITKDSADLDEKLTSNVLDLSVMTGMDRFTFQAGYGWLLSHKWTHETKNTTTNSAAGGGGFFNVGFQIGILELVGGYRVWSILYNVNKSWYNSNNRALTSDEKGQLAYKEMYLGLGYIF